MSDNNEYQRFVSSVWWSELENKPVLRQSITQKNKENIRDGLYVFHNPYAKKPIAPNMFKLDGITQVFVDPDTRKITKERNGDCLMHRLTMNIIKAS